MVQLPPNLEFQIKIASKFIQSLKTYCSVPIFWELRHCSWSQEEALRLLLDHDISKVIANPEPCPLQSQFEEIHWPNQYFRLHGQPLIYKSRYSIGNLVKLGSKIKTDADYVDSTWVIFDNTTYGYATENAIELKNIMIHRSKNTDSPTMTF